MDSDVVVFVQQVLGSLVRTTCASRISRVLVLANRVGDIYCRDSQMSEGVSSAYTRPCTYVRSDSRWRGYHVSQLDLLPT